MVFLMETKLRASRLESIRLKLGFECLFVVDSNGRRGGLALLWKTDFHVSIQNFSLRHINAWVYSAAVNFTWQFTGFYGHPEVCKRKESWALLKHLSTISSSHWICVGDFNEILQDSEKRGGARRRWSQMVDFRTALDHCHLNDMGFSGAKYTWSNRRRDCMFTKERLDRAVGTISFAQKFPQLLVDVLAARCSDHAPLLISLHNTHGRHRQRRGLFRYEAWWQRQAGFQQVITQVWKPKKISCNPWEPLKENFLKSQHVCKNWQKVHADPTDHLILQKTLMLGELQEEGEVSDMDHLNSLQEEVNNLIEMEDLKWKQRAKQNWLQHGDRNSKFFHACVNQRRKKNLILQITDSAGI